MTGRACQRLSRHLVPTQRGNQALSTRCILGPARVPHAAWETDAGRVRPGGGRTRRASWAAVLVVVAFTVLSACSLFSYSPTELPAPPAAPAPTPAPSTTPPPPCRNPTASYAPGGSLPSPNDLPSGSTMARIRERGRLVAGVSADTYLLASRNPLNGQIEGFDIDMVRAVTKAIFGDETKYQPVSYTHLTLPTTPYV